ncbi:MAG: putative metal-dependent hydrolase [Candidatus Paceibacter sp.]|jgi:predicted metal-dependent hydrolase|nr:putative metal-dependent hydrolase [Candidatus Paceibacter sp.]
MNYTIKRHKRARRVTISVHANGAVTVTVPMRADLAKAAHFIKAKEPWIIQTQEKLKKRFEGKTPLKQSRSEYQALKKQTLAFVQERIAHYNKHYNFKFGRISIRMQKSRWGSCSRKGNLNFNYKLVQLPQSLADYIVVHELCHLKQFNHSIHFWNLVAEAIPDHKARRAELRKKYIHVS